MVGVPTLHFLAVQPDPVQAAGLVSDHIEAKRRALGLPARWVMKPPMNAG
jgi:hydroxylamine reductase (hybrid-cluster protein)